MLSRKFIILIISFSILIISFLLFYVVFIKEQDTNRIFAKFDRLENKLNNPDLTIKEHVEILSRLEGIYVRATFQAQEQLIATMKSSWNITPVPEMTRLSATESGVIIWKPPDGISDPPERHNPINGYDRSTKILNSWRKTASDHSYLVYAGFLIDDPNQGMVIIPLKDHPYWYRMYLTPKRSGAVRVVYDYGLYVVLQAENGDLFTFDPITERFITSLDAPTIMPTPSD